MSGFSQKVKTTKSQNETSEETQQISKENAELERLQVSRTCPRQVKLKTLSAHYNAIVSSPCVTCFECRSGHISTFHLNYFEYYGLNTDNAMKVLNNPSEISVPLESYQSLPITWDLVAQAFEIMERRIHEIKAVPTLFGLCTVTIVQYCHNIDVLPLPDRLKLALREFTSGFDIVEQQMSKTPGNTMFRPWNFPRFLFNHLESYLHY